MREAGKASGFKKVTHDSAALKKAKNFDTRGDALKLEAGEVTLFYEFFGEGGLDTIVLLSGAGIGADMFSVDKAAYPDLGDDFEKGVAAQLADKTGCRVLTIDYRGHGRSSYASDTAPSTDNTIALHALDIIAVLKQLGLTSGCHFVGTSLGYLVSVAVAGLEPSYVLSISGHGASLGPALGLVGRRSRCRAACSAASAQSSSRRRPRAPPSSRRRASSSRSSATARGWTASRRRSSRAATPTSRRCCRS